MAVEPRRGKSGRAGGRETQPWVSGARRLGEAYIAWGRRLGRGTGGTRSISSTGKNAGTPTSTGTGDAWRCVDPGGGGGGKVAVRGGGSRWRLCVGGGAGKWQGGARGC